MEHPSLNSTISHTWMKMKIHNQRKKKPNSEFENKGKQTNKMEIIRNRKSLWESKPLPRTIGCWESWLGETPLSSERISTVWSEEKTIRIQSKETRHWNQIQKKKKKKKREVELPSMAMEMESKILNFCEEGERERDWRGRRRSLRELERGERREERGSGEREWRYSFKGGEVTRDREGFWLDSSLNWVNISRSIRLERALFL